MIRDPGLVRWLVYASASLSIAGLAFVLRDIRRPDGDPRQMKPQLVSWGIWAVLMAEGSVAALRAGQLPAGVYGLACAGGCVVVAMLGWRDRSWDWLSRGCAAVAGACLVLMIAVSDPALVIALTVAADMAAFAPTIGHAWARPGEESWQGYGLYGLGAWAGLAVASLTMTSMTYLAYLAVADTAVPVMIVLRRKRQPGTTDVESHWPYWSGLPGTREPALAAPAAWEPVTGLVWEALPGQPVQEQAEVARWRPPHRPASTPPGPWVSPAGPLI